MIIIKRNDQEKDEIEIAETNYFRIISLLAVTVFFYIFIITLGVLLIDMIGVFIGIGILILCPLTFLSYRGYFNNLRKKFIISAEEIRLQKTHSEIKIRWDDFDILRISAKGEFYIDFPSTSAISREYTLFRLGFIDRESNKIVQSWKFRFYKTVQAREVLNLLKQNARMKGKEITLKTKHM